MTPLDRVISLPIWSGPVKVEPLGGGITNLNFVAQDRARKTVVRIGDDIPLHQILRSNELAASQAAFQAGVSPAVLPWTPKRKTSKPRSSRTNRADREAGRRKAKC